MEKNALVTGATSGIGRAIALMLARQGYSVAIAGRRLPQLRELSEEIVKESGQEPFILNFDVRDKHLVFGSYFMLSDSWKANLDVVVNNAGISLGFENFVDCDDNEWDEMIDTNIRGTLYVSQIVAQTMKENGKGLIINVSSVSAREIEQNNSVYSITKSAVDTLTKVMRADLQPFGVRVSSIALGPVNTDFSITRHRGDVERANRANEGKKLLTPNDVASAIEFMISRPDYVCVNDLVLNPVNGKE